MGLRLIMDIQLLCLIGMFVAFEAVYLGVMPILMVREMIKNEEARRRQEKEKESP